MLNLNTIYTTKVKVDKPYQIIMSPSDSNKNIIMTYISEDEEKALDNDEVVKLKRGKQTFTISRRNVYAYGEIDFTTGSEDYELLTEKNWFGNIELVGVLVPVGYDYKDNLIYNKVKGGTWYDTIRTEVICQFKHGQLGKPKRTVIFKL